MAGYLGMLKHLELAIWVLQVKSTRPRFTILEAYQLLAGSGVKVTESQFRHWHSNGHNYLCLVHASSIHILAAISLSVLRDVTNHLTEPAITQVENSLRQPNINDASFSDLISSEIIHFLFFLQASFPSGIPIAGCTLGADQAADDEWLGMLLRCGTTDFEVWGRGPQWSPSNPIVKAPDERHDPSNGAPIYRVETQFDAQLPKNQLLPKKLRKAQPNNYEWTEAERKLALNAKSPANLEEFETLVIDHLKTGCKQDGSYIWLRKELYQE
ncbi:hypothetical protein FRC11_004659 [Ceratobasidium sp. 423]|nr:hypothetical protein FRC11_004659 [Ceratobasidium sp. 423]